MKNDGNVLLCSTFSVKGLFLDILIGIIVAVAVSVIGVILCLVAIFLPESAAQIKAGLIFVSILCWLIGGVDLIFGVFYRALKYALSYARITETGIQGRESDRLFKTFFVPFDCITNVIVSGESGIVVQIKARNEKNLLEKTAYIVENVANNRFFCEQFWKISGKEKPIEAPVAAEK